LSDRCGRDGHFYSICLLAYNIYNKPNTPQSVSRPSLSSPAISVAPAETASPGQLVVVEYRASSLDVQPQVPELLSSGADEEGLKRLDGSE